MDLAQFEHDLDRYGGDLDRWPAAARAAADALISTAPVAGMRLALMQRLEAALRADGRADVAPLVLGRLAATAGRHKQARPTQRVAVRAAWAATAAAALTFGLVVGDLLPDRHIDPARLMSAAFAPQETIDVD